MLSPTSSGNVASPNCNHVTNGSCHLFADPPLVPVDWLGWAPDSKLGQSELSYGTFKFYCGEIHITYDYVSEQFNSILCNHHLYLVPKCFHHLQRKPHTS